jgi:hypothetical protein
LDDEDVDARDEAIAGLARRNDQRVVEPLLHELMSGQVGIVLFEAAKEIADSRLYPALLKIQNEAIGLADYEREELARAISKCRGIP